MHMFLVSVFLGVGFMWAAGHRTMAPNDLDCLVLPRLAQASFVKFWQILQSQITS